MSEVVTPDYLDMSSMAQKIHRDAKLGKSVSEQEVLAIVWARRFQDDNPNWKHPLKRLMRGNHIPLDQVQAQNQQMWRFRLQALKHQNERLLEQFGPDEAKFNRLWSTEASLIEDWQWQDIFRGGFPIVGVGYSRIAVPRWEPEGTDQQVFYYGYLEDKTQPLDANNNPVGFTPPRQGWSIQPMLSYLKNAKNIGKKSNYTLHGGSKEEWHEVGDSRQQVLDGGKWPAYDPMDENVSRGGPEAGVGTEPPAGIEWGGKYPVAADEGVDINHWNEILVGAVNAEMGYENAEKVRNVIDAINKTTR